LAHAAMQRVTSQFPSGVTGKADRTERKSQSIEYNTT
jgi:hypothetical protein